MLGCGPTVAISGGLLSSSRQHARPVGGPNRFALTGFRHHSSGLPNQALIRDYPFVDHHPLFEMYTPSLCFFSLGLGLRAPAKKKERKTF